MPATSIFISAASSAMSGIGNSRISVLLGPVRTAAKTFSATTRLQPTSKLFRLALGHVLVHVHFEAAREQRAPHLYEIPRHRVAGDSLPIAFERLLGLVL